MKWRPINEAIPRNDDEEDQDYLGRDSNGNVAFISYYPGAKGWKSSVFDHGFWLWFIDLRDIELPEGEN